MVEERADARGVPELGRGEQPEIAARERVSRAEAHERGIGVALRAGEELDASSRGPACFAILPTRGPIVYVSGRAEEAGTSVVRVVRLDTTTGATSHRTIPKIEIGAIPPLLAGDPVGPGDPMGITAVALFEAPEHPLVVLTLEP